MDRQYRLALLIILIPLITLAASTLTYYFGYKPSEINANGTPIEPKIQTQNLNLIDVNTACVILETIQVVDGFILPKNNYLKKIK